MPNSIPIGQPISGHQIDADFASTPFGADCSDNCPTYYNGSSDYNCNEFCFEFKADYYGDNYFEQDVVWETGDYGYFDTPINVNLSGQSGDYTKVLDNWLTDGDILGGIFFTYCFEDVSIVTGKNNTTNNAGLFYAARNLAPINYTFSQLTNSSVYGYTEIDDFFDPLDLDTYFTTREIDGNVVFSFGDRHYTTVFKRKTHNVIIAEDGFFHFKFKNVNTNSITVNIRDNTATIIFTSESTELGFDKVVELEAGTYDLEFVLNDISVNECVMEEGYEFARITDLVFRQLCDVTPELWTTSGTYVGSTEDGLITETRVEYTETLGNSYSRNSTFCIDLSDEDIDEGVYYFKINICSLTELFVTNCFVVSDNAPNLTNISWDNGIIDSGCDDTIDSNGCIFFKMDLQDFTVQDEREVYRMSNSCFTVPYSRATGVQTLQIVDVSPFMRFALSTALMGTFTLNGVEYQKVESEDITPQFQTKYDTMVRLLVHKVGDTITKTNC